MQATGTVVAIAVRMKSFPVLDQNGNPTGETQAVEVHTATVEGVMTGSPFVFRIRDMGDQPFEMGQIVPVGLGN